MEFTRKGDVLKFKIVDVTDKHIKSVPGVIDYAKDAENRGIIVFDSTGFEGKQKIINNKNLRLYIKCEICRDLWYAILYCQIEKKNYLRNAVFQE